MKVTLHLANGENLPETNIGGTAELMSYIEKCVSIHELRPFSDIQDKVDEFHFNMNLKSEHSIHISKNAFLQINVDVKPKYNHAFEIAFSLDSDNDGENVTAKEMIDALERRVRDLKANNDEIIEACGLPYDTYENNP